MIVMMSPLFQDYLRFLERIKCFCVQAFIAQPPVKAFVVAVLPRTARFDIEGLDAQLRQPSPDGFGRKFRAVVGADVIGDSFSNKQISQNRHHIIRAQFVICAQAEAFPRVFIDYRQRADFRPILETVGHEVIRPDMIGPAGSQADA